MSPLAYTHFRLEQHHLALLARANVEWDSSPGAGAPCINPRHPYGSEPTLSIVARVLGLDGTRELRTVRDQDGNSGQQLMYPDSTVMRCRRVHEETLYALQVILQTGRADPGQYTSDGKQWRRGQ